MIHINNSIYCNKYMIQDNSAQHLLDLGFRKFYEPDEQYIYNFPILKHENTVTLRGRIIVYTDTKEIKIDVLDNNFVSYRPFYNIEFGDYEPIMEKINKSILKEFKKLGIVKYKEKEKND